MITKWQIQWSIDNTYNSLNCAMFEKTPASNRWISLKCKDLLEGENQIITQLRNGFSIVLLGNIPVNRTSKILMLVVI